MSDLIFGKDKTERVIGVEPSRNDTCTLFVQGTDGNVATKEVPLSHWILYKEQHSPKMKPLEGNQPYKYIMEYDSAARYEEVLKSTRFKRLEHYVSRDAKEAFMMKEGVTYFKGLKVKDVSILSFDLEHTYGVGDTLNPKGKILLISNTFRDSQGNIQKRLFAFDEHPTQKAMFEEWVSWVCSLNPSLVTGHNVFGHDFKVLRFAFQREGARLKLGRDYSDVHFDSRVSMFRKDGSQAYEYNNAQIYGRDIVDTFFLAIKYDVARNYESYGLKAIIKHEGLEKAGRIHYDASKIAENYTNPEEWSKIKAYAIDDADDALALFDLMIAPFFYATQSIPRSLQHVINSASGSQVNSIMVRGYLQQGHSIAEASERVDYEGAISFGIPGMHKNVLRFDVSSLYPSVIRQYKIFNKEKDPQGLFLQMVNYFTEERLGNKQKGKETGDRHYKDLEQSQKIMINSMYGFLGMGRANYNYPEGAAAVTRYGREILKKAILWATGKHYDGEAENNEVEDNEAA